MEDRPLWINASHTEPQARLLGRDAGAHLELVNRLGAIADQKHMNAVSRLGDCCRWPALYQEPESGRFVMARKTCKHRLCPRCGRSRSAKLAAEATQLMEGMNAPKFLTLTLASSARPLKEQLQDLRASFTRLRRSKEWRRHATRGVAVVEVTHNPRTDQFHPHLHLIVDCDYWPQRELSAAWSTASHGSYICHIRAIPDRRDAVRYVAKYAAKTGDHREIPDHRINEWLDALAGLRSHSLFGPGVRARTKKAPKPDRPRVEIVTRLDIIHDMANDGRDEARWALRAIYAMARRRVPDSPDGTPGVDEARHLQIALLLRTLGVPLPSDNRVAVTAPSEHSPPIGDAHNRPVRLWEEPGDGPTGLPD